MATVSVPARRWVRWAANFAERHPGGDVVVDAGVLRASADDGSTYLARLPFGRTYAGPTNDPRAFADAAAPPDDWGLLLVRKGGFAVAHLHGERVVASKVGQRHVQGRTKAGGQSQQRFARRRDNQARQAYEAAADHAARVLGDLTGPLVTGGDRTAVAEVLADPRLSSAAAAVDARWLAVPDPRRAVLEQAVVDACAVDVEIHDTTRPMG